jgi:membrane protein DedA with SNARE-associated domain
MHYFLSPFSSFVTVHPVLAYGALFIGVLWEGEFVLIMAGILVHLKVFGIVPTLSIVVVSASIKTVLGYYLGRFLGKTFPKSRILKYFERRVFYYLPRFKERPFWSIFISKFIYGVNNATLVFSGFVNVNFKTYCIAEAVSSIFWLGGMFVLGNYFSQTALSISHNFRYFMLIILLFTIGFMILQKTINLIIEIFEEIGMKEEVK